MLAIDPPSAPLRVQDMKKLDKVVSERIQALIELETLVQTALENRAGANQTIPPALDIEYNRCLTDICANLAWSHLSTYGTKITAVLIEEQLIPETSKPEDVFHPRERERMRGFIHSLVRVSHPSLVQMLYTLWPTRWFGKKRIKFRSFIELFFVFQKQRAAIWSLGPFVCWMASQPSAALSRRMTEWLITNTRMSFEQRTKLHWLCAIVIAQLPEDSCLARFWLALEATSISIELHHRVKSAEHLQFFLDRSNWSYKMQVQGQSVYFSINRDKHTPTKDAFWLAEDCPFEIGRGWTQRMLLVMDMFRERNQNGTLENLIEFVL